MSEQTYNSKDFDIFGLSAAVRNHGLFKNKNIMSARDFVTSLTVAANGESGLDFWAWMLEHLIDNTIRENEKEGFYETLFLLNRQDSTVIGSISAVRDDRGRGAYYKLPGMWIGGFNILPKFQNRGLGSHLMTILLEKIEFNQKFIQKKPVTVNLFTTNLIVKKLVEKKGFTENKNIILDAEDLTQSVYIRVFGEEIK